MINNLADLTDEQLSTWLEQLEREINEVVAEHGSILDKWNKLGCEKIRVFNERRRREGAREYGG